MTKVWLVTGSGSGLGYSIAEAVLASGDNIVAGARRPEQLASLVERYPGRITPVKHDVRHEAAAQSAAEAALSQYGRLDVLVNNAGYGHFAPFEQITSEEFRDIVETCFFGVVFTTRAALPVMRRQRSGHIFQISSVGGRMTMPGNSPYHAAKWAVGGFSDSLAAEVETFGVKVCTLEPGGIRTNWANRAGENTPRLFPEYEESVGTVYRLLESVRGQPEGDPKKIADLIVRLSNMEQIPRRLILGRDAENRVRSLEELRTAEAGRYRAMTLSTVAEEALNS